MARGVQVLPMQESHHPKYGSLFNWFAFDLIIFPIDSYVEFVP